MSYIEELANVPDFDLIENTTLESLREQMLSAYSEKYEEATGTVPTLREGNPFRMVIDAFALQTYQILEMINYAAKQNFLKYAEGESLDHLAAFKGLERETAAPAHTTLQFSMDDARSDTVGIPGGTRVCTESEVVYVTDEYVEIEPGQTSVIVSASAEEAGTDGNGYAAGTVTEMMDLVPYISAVTNTEETTGGKDVQSDEDFTRDILAAPKGTSMGGPEDAYEALAYKMRPDVYDVKSISPTPCYVDVYFTLDDGAIPTAADLQAMETYFDPKSMRPMGDRVSAKAPTEVEYSISFTYYIAESDASAEQEIKRRVVDAVEGYKTWQRKIGRDVNPSELIRLVMQAGARRVALTAPEYTLITGDAENGVKISKLKTESIIYGGMEP